MSTFINILEMSPIPLDFLVCLAAVAVETRNMSFKGPLSAKEVVTGPCQNHQSTEKQRKDLAIE